MNLDFQNTRTARPNLASSQGLSSDWAEGVQERGKKTERQKRQTAPFSRGHVYEIPLVCTAREKERKEREREREREGEERDREREREEREREREIERDREIER